MPTNAHVLMSATELATVIDKGNVSIIDATWRLDGGKGIDSYRAGHIPHARFFDIDGIADPDTDLPHMLPTPEHFAKAAGALVSDPDDLIVVYDNSPLRSAARVWWTFMVMGIDNVRVLNGGLQAWIDAGFPLSKETSDPTDVILPVTPRREWVIGYEDMNKAVDDPRTLIIDARPTARFLGQAPEPRPGVQSGAMPNAKNLPLGQLYTDNGQMRPRDELARIFQDLGTDQAERIITTCGSGVTASSLALALHTLGYTHVSVYDGSWAEWGARSQNIVPVPPQ